MSLVEVERSILIGVPIEEVYATVRDFKSWPQWSPWLCAEPNCQLDFTSDGTSYQWNGEVVGAGQMRVTSERANQSIDYELTLTSPIKSVAQVRFLFVPEGDRTRTTWEMKSKLPLSLFWMKGILSANIGMDYRRGLTMLKDYLQLGHVPFEVTLQGVHQFPGLSFVGIKTDCRIVDIAEKMEADMNKLQKWIQDQHITPAGLPLSIYHKWSPVQGTTRYTLAFPVEKIPGWLPENFTSGKIPPCSTQKIQHTGSYNHLISAWAVGHAYTRAKKWQSQRSIAPFEIYESDPEKTLAEKLVTSIHFPQKV